jgi:hypothetical protein
LNLPSCFLPLPTTFKVLSNPKFMPIHGVKPKLPSLFPRRKTAEGSPVILQTWGSTYCPLIHSSPSVNFPNLQPSLTCTSSTS